MDRPRGAACAEACARPAASPLFCHVISPSNLSPRPFPRGLRPPFPSSPSLGGLGPERGGGGCKTRPPRLPLSGPGSRVRQVRGLHQSQARARKRQAGESARGLLTHSPPPIFFSPSLPPLPVSRPAVAGARHSGRRRPRSYPRPADRSMRNKAH